MGVADHFQGELQCFIVPHPTPQLTQGERVWRHKSSLWKPCICHFTVQLKYLLSVPHYSNKLCSLVTSGADPRIWTCDTRPLLLMRAGWGLDARLVLSAVGSSCLFHLPLIVGDNVTLIRLHFTPSQISSLELAGLHRDLLVLWGWLHFWRARVRDCVRC